MELYHCIEGRRSCRSFIPKPVDKPTLTKVLAAASRSPSDTNTQPWEVFVVAGEKKDILAKKLVESALSGTAPQPDLPFPEEWPDQIEKRSKEHRLRRFEALGIDPNDGETVRQIFLKNFQFYDAPCVLFLGTEKSLTPWSILDLGLFAASLLLAAHAEGLGCCPQTVPISYPGIIRNELGIPPTIALILTICIGYPDLKAEINQYRSARRDLNECVKWFGVNG